MKTIYKSDLKELANKEFESVEDLEKAEAEISEKIAAKQKASEEKKAEADVVKAAISERINAEKEAHELKCKAYKTYLEACDEADKKVADLKKAEAEELKKFSEKYGGFHDYITIGDITYKYDYSLKNSYYDPFKRLIDFWF